MPAGLFESRTLSLLDQQGHAFIERWNPLSPVISPEILSQAYHHRLSLHALVEASSREIKKLSQPVDRKVLLRAHFLFTAQLEIDKKELRWDGARKWHQDALTCLNLLYPQTPLGQQANPSFFSGKISQVKQAISLLDRERVYWGWSRQLILNSVLLIPDVFGRRDNTNSSLDGLSVWLGFLSYLTLSTHLLLELMLTIKDTFTGPWLVNQIFAWEQFKTQLNTRKFAILDDFISIASNLVAFLWLTGEVNLGPFGPVLTASFRTLYLGLITWRYEETEAEFKKTVESYERDILELRSMSPVPQKEVKFLLRELALCKRQFKFKKNEFYNELYYLLGLFIGIALLCCLAFPPVFIPVAIALVIAFISYAISFFSVFKFHQGRGKNTITLHEEAIHDKEQELATMLNEFRKTTNLDLKKELYAQGKALAKEVKQEKIDLEEEKNTLFYQSTLKAMLPAVVLVAFICFPLWGALAVLAAGMILTTYMSTAVPGSGIDFTQDGALDQESFDEFAASPNDSFNA
ncbi:MAG: hypothetical protein ACOYKA_03590 [Legionellaceae bacterium]